jgi:hypothetical protein
MHPHQPWQQAHRHEWYLSYVCSNSDSIQDTSSRYYISNPSSRGRLYSIMIHLNAFLMPKVSGKIIHATASPQVNEHLQASAVIYFTRRPLRTISLTAIKTRCCHACKLFVTLYNILSTDDSLGYTVNHQEVDHDIEYDMHCKVLGPAWKQRNRDTVSRIAALAMVIICTRDAACRISSPTWCWSKTESQLSKIRAILTSPGWI